MSYRSPLNCHFFGERLVYQVCIVFLVVALMKKLNFNVLNSLVFVGVPYKVKIPTCYSRLKYIIGVLIDVLKTFLLFHVNLYVS